MTLEKVGGAKAQSTAFLAVKSHFSLQMILLTCTPPDPLVGSISQISVPQSDHPNCHPRVAATLRNEKVSERDRARVGAAVHESISEEAETEEAKTSEREFAAAAVVVESSNSKTNPEKQSQFVCPSLSEIITEAKSLFHLSFPIALTALILYSRSIFSMLFLGHLGDIQLAAGSLAIAFANITGYSVLSGLALGMEPLCSQAFGAQRPKLLSLTLHRSVIFLLFSSVPISLLWLNMSKILLYLHQDPDITRHHPPSHNSITSWYHPPLTHQPHPRLPPSTRRSRRRRRLLCLQLLRTDLPRVLRVGPRDTRANVDRAEHRLPDRVEAAAPAGGPQLRVGVFGVVVVRDHDRTVWASSEPQGNGCINGCSDTNDVVDYVFPSSLGFAVSSRVGNELGANRPDKARVSAMVSVFLAGVMGFSATMFASGMRDRWGRMFTSDVEILRLTSAALPILGLCELGNCPQTVGCGVLRGSARPSTAANVNLGAFYLVGMPVAVGLGFWLGVGFCGLWVGLLAAQVCCAGMMLYVVGTTDWNYQAMRAKTLTCAGCGDTVSPLPTADTKDEEQPLICIVVTSSS
ncbi:Protein detoxification 52 [Vitis vinifera]|uniref:Protein DETOXIFICATION n=1 Tax=Vitis vinifera TaxID=29760 RepID=A0A438IHY4_VITVI|nr:Protein detoxification 52 [Vitis vinifera]